MGPTATGLSCLLLAVATSTAARSAEPIVFTQIPLRAEPAMRSTPLGLPDGSRIVRFDASQPDKGVVNLTPSFSAAGRPDVSFDGERILFVGRRSQADRFAIWEMGIDGSKLRQIADTPGSVHKAIYLSTIYTLDADEPVFQMGFLCAASEMQPAALYTCRMDGTRLRRISFNPRGATDPFQLSDGRLLFTRWRRSDSPSIETTDLMAIHTDGTDLFVFAAAHQPPAIRSMPAETADGWIVYVESEPTSPTGGGRLKAVKRTRSLHSTRTLADATDGTYHSPSALSDHSLLVSFRSSEAASYGLYTLDTVTGMRRSQIYDDPEWHDVYARPVTRRPIPAGRSSVVVDTVDHGLLYCMNAYLSDLASPRDIRPGDIKRVQVFKALSGAAVEHPISAGSAHPKELKEVLLGEAPVRADGSFALQVPARTPLRLATLDENGQTLQAMETYLWVMPKEARGCIGCHEDRELTPPNRHVEALRKEPHAIGLEPTERRERVMEERYKRNVPEE